MVDSPSRRTSQDCSNAAPSAGLMQLMSVLVDIAATQPEANVLSTCTPDAPEVATEAGPSPQHDHAGKTSCATSSPKSPKRERVGAL